MKFVSACLLFFAAFVALSLPVYAHEDFPFPEVTDGQINEALLKTVPLRFLPSHPLYFLISFRESISRFFQPSSIRRGQFDLVLSGKRLKEAYLLLEKGDVKRASKTLTRYRARIQAMINQIEKARSQNQDVAALADEIAERLHNHEVLLSAINNKWQLMEDSFGFDANLEGAVFGFQEVVKTIDNIKPGLKDRFRLVTGIEDKGRMLTPTPAPQILEATPTVRPRRIIY